MTPNVNPDRIQPLAELVNATAGEDFSVWSARPGTRVRDAAAFAEMKAHIANRYAGVEAAHSFVDSNGQVFDCIPIEQQPAMRGSQSPAIANAPDAPPVAEASHPRQEALQVEPQLGQGKQDVYGNTMACPPGTIPIRRVTLEELTKFETVQHFHQKSPIGKGRHPRLSEPEAASDVHKYAHAYQTVDNLGGHNFLNIWAPTIGANQVFSVSQHWYSGGSGSALQTAEVGWQVYPGKYNSTNPVLFVYWTADDYNTTGCYNLDCTAFVQVNSSWALGGALTTVSITGGSQAELEVAYYYYQGNWWLYLGGMGSAQAVGYYPASLYRGGQLAKNAADIDFNEHRVHRHPPAPKWGGRLPAARAATRPGSP